MSSDLTIGLALSGGGFRASTFSLGTLSYLDSLRLADKSLLEHVVVLSTVSGGTITGTYYALKKSNGVPFAEIYSDLRSFMRNHNLVDLGIEALLAAKKEGGPRIRGVITAFADVYNEHLFRNAKFGEIMKDDKDFHLKHISFNATDFKSPLQFRFQWSESIARPAEGEPRRGIIGNKYFAIPEEVAREIRLADILASSSCFPGGFEPINFPDDFVFREFAAMKAKLLQTCPETIGLMDGGIVDNQGIEPVILADDRINRNRYPELKKEQYPDHALDLVILSDVASPYMKKFIASVEKGGKWWSPLSLKRILNLNLLLTLLAAAGFIFRPQDCTTLLVLSSALATINALVYLLTFFIWKKFRKIKLVHEFRKPFRKLLNLKFGVMATMIDNRVKSVMKMTGEVYLKQIRRLNYKVLYNDPAWKNRLIMNAIYELRKGEERLDKKRRKHQLPERLFPSDLLQNVAQKAAGMSTTLWFTGEELNPGGGERNMPDTLIACGQFNICWNLLEYLETIKRDPANTNDHHRALLSLEKMLLDDWDRFNKDPYWLVDSPNRKTVHP